MSALADFETVRIDDSLLADLPLPVAQLYRRAFNAKTPVDRFHASFYLWEASLKLIGAAAVVSYAHLQQRDAGVARQLESLSRPSTGHWWSFVRTLTPLLADAGDEGFGAVKAVLLSRSRDDLPRAAGLDAALREALGDPDQARSTVRPPELFERLVRLRNQEIGHGAAGQRPREFYSSLARAMLGGLSNILGKLDLLAGRRLIYVSDVRMLPSRKVLVERYRLHGESPARLESLEAEVTDLAALPQPQRLYLEQPSTAGEAGEAPLPTLSMHPLVLFDEASSECFFLNSQRGKRKAEYLCYTSGRVERRDELGADRRELMADIFGTAVDEQMTDRWEQQSCAEEAAPDESEELHGASSIGEFELLSRIGRGGMGVVYRAWQPSLSRHVALKCCLRSGDPKAEARFSREIRALGRVEHANLVKVFTSGAHGDQWFYAMEIVDGADLAAVLGELQGQDVGDLSDTAWVHAVTTAHDRARQSEEALSEDWAAPAAERDDEARVKLTEATGRSHVAEVVEIIRQVARALHALHEAGVVHRDVKPGNIMLTGDGRAVLMDLGLAQLADDSEGKLTRTRQFVGTLRYASPEQILAAEKVRRQADVYSLGATLWELLTLRPLFSADDGMPTPELMLRIQTTDPERPRKHNRHVPADLEAVVLKCLEKDPARRYSTAQELEADLTRFLNGDPVAAQPPSLKYLLGKYLRRHKVALATASAIAVAAVVGVVLAFVQITGERNRALKAERDAIDARNLADEQKQKAIESSRLAAQRFEEKRTALDEMLATFSSQGLKNQPGSQPIRRQFLEAGIDQYQRMLADRAEDVPVLLQASQAYRELGLVTSELADEEASSESLEKAVEMCRKAAAADDSPAIRAALGDALYELGQSVLTFDRRDPEILRLGAEAREIFKQLHQQRPDEVEYKAKLGRSIAFHLLGWKLAIAFGNDARELDPQHAAAEVQQASGLLRAAVEAAPDNAEYASDLGRVLGNAASGRFSEDFDGALADSLEAARLQEKALTLNPSLVTALQRREIYLRNAANQLLRAGRHDEALTLVDDGIRSARQYVLDNPSVPAGQASLASLLGARAQVLGYLDKKPQAIEDREEQAAIFADLARRRPRTAEYPLEQVRALRKIVPLAAEQESLEMMKRIAELAEPMMRRHPTSKDLLSQLMGNDMSRGNKLLGGLRPEAATEAFRRGLGLYADYAASVEGMTEAEMAAYLDCLDGLQRSYEQLEEHEKIVATAPLLEQIPLQELTTLDYQEKWLRAKSNLAAALEETGQSQKALESRVLVRDTARALLGEDIGRNWYLYQDVFGAHHPIANLAAKVGDQRLEFEALRDFLDETASYVHDRDHSELLQRTKEFTPQNLKLLRDAHDKEFEAGSMKKFTIPVRFDGVDWPFDIYVTRSLRFLEDQYRFIEEVRGGVFPADVKEAFRKLYDLAKKNGVSFPDLCVYALSAAADESVRERRAETPIGVADDDLAETNNSFVAISAAREAARNNADDPRATLALLRTYGRLAEAELARNNLVRVGFHVNDMLQVLDAARQKLDSPDLTAAENNVRFLRGALRSARGSHQQAYDLLVETLDAAPDAENAAAMSRPGAREFALGWTAERLGRPGEATIWYRRAADAEHAYALPAIYFLWADHPEVARLLAPPIQLALSEAARQHEVRKEAVAKFEQLMSQGGESEPGGKPGAVAAAGDDATLLPAIAEHYRKIGESYRQQNKLPEALQAFLNEVEVRERLARGKPEFGSQERQWARASFDVANLYARTGDKKSGIQWLVKAGERGRYEAFFTAARVHEQGLGVPANKTLAGTLRHYGNFQHARQLYNDGQYAEALAKFREAGKLKADNPDCFEGIARTCKRLGRWDESIAAYRKSLQLTPDNAAVHLKLMEALLVSGRHDELISYGDDPITRGRVDDETFGTDERFMFHALHAIALAAEGDDPTPAADLMRKHADGPLFHSDWSWAEIDDWLGSMQLEAEPLARVRDVVKEAKAAAAGQVDG